MRAMETFAAKHAANLMGLFYRDTVRYADQVKRYFDTFGRSNVRVVLFDDFRADAARVLRETCDFLGVDSGFHPRLEVVNSNKRVRSEALRHVLRFAPDSLRALLRPLLPSPRLRGTLKSRLKPAQHGVCAEGTDGSAAEGAARNRALARGPTARRTPRTRFDELGHSPGPGRRDRGSITSPR
jgi:hypothetical protein